MRTVHTGGDGDAFLRAHVTSAAGAPLIGASLNIEKGGATTSKEGGDAFLRIAAADIPSNHAVTVFTRLIGYRVRRASVKVLPGDTVNVEVSLCAQPDDAAADGRDWRGSGSASKDEQTTNVQSVGVDEGDIVKLAGRYLVILRRGRLFTVDVGQRETDERELRSRAAVNAFGPEVDPAGTWYDELIVYRDRIVVIGYSYQRNGAELGLFRNSGRTARCASKAPISFDPTTTTRVATMRRASSVESSSSTRRFPSESRRTGHPLHSLRSGAGKSEQTRRTSTRSPHTHTFSASWQIRLLAATSCCMQSRAATWTVPRSPVTREWSWARRGACSTCRRRPCTCGRRAGARAMLRPSPAGKHLHYSGCHSMDHRHVRYASPDSRSISCRSRRAPMAT